MVKTVVNVGEKLSEQAQGVKMIRNEHIAALEDLAGMDLVVRALGAAANDDPKSTRLA
jgi:hypothetical protein